MKRLLLLLGLLIGTACYAQDCSFMCAEPYDLSHGVSRFMSTVTGSRLLGEKVAQIILRKSIVKSADGGKYKINVDSYSTKDLRKGIFKKIDIKGKNVIIDGINFSEIRLKTVCDFNYIDIIDPTKPIFKEDLPFEFHVVMTEEDINRSMQSDSYRKIISKINSMGFIKILSDNIEIKDDEFLYVIKAAVPFGSMTIVIASDLKVSRGKIDFSNTRLVNDSMYIDLKKLDKLINYLNPLDYSLKVLENNHATLSVKNVEIKNNKVHADGWVVIPKN